MDRTRHLSGMWFLAIVLTITGCSFSYVYRQLDWLVPWYVSDFITLDEAQRSVLETRLLDQLDWHCSTQLDRYAKWFRQLHDTPDAFSRHNLDRHYETTRRFWRDLMERVTPDVARILQSASEEQVSELIRNLERRQHDSDKKYKDLDATERNRKRIERMTRMLERWVGELDLEQRKKIAAWSKALGEPNDELWLRNRQQWQTGLVEALSRRKDRDYFTQRVHMLLVEPDKLWSASYRGEYEKRRKLTLDMLADMASSMSQVQRAHLQHELLSWANEFESLACSVETRENAAKQR